MLEAGGWNCFLRTLLMLLTAVALSIAELVLFSESYCGALVIMFTFTCWCFRKSIGTLGADYSRYSGRFLSAYGLALLVADRAGFGVQSKFAVVTFACIFMFNLNFWSITEAAVVDK